MSARTPYWNYKTPVKLSNACVICVCESIGNKWLFSERICQATTAHKCCHTCSFAVLYNTSVLNPLPKKENISLLCWIEDICGFCRST